MDQRTEVVNRLNRHQPSKWRWWICSCGHRNPCPARQIYLEALRAWNNRDREARVMQKLRFRSTVDRLAQRVNQRPWPPLGQQSTWPPR